MHINCILPNYYNEKWLVPNIGTLYRKRSRRHCLTFSVIDQRETSVSESEPLKEHLDGLLVGDDVSLEFWSVVNPEKRGGQSLPRVLRAGMYHRVGGEDRPIASDISITIDTDTLVYPQSWDALLLDLYGDESVMVAGINPRCTSPPASGPDTPELSRYDGVVEWNFMSFRTAFWHERIRSFRASGIDIGHRFTQAVEASPGCRQVLFPPLYKPIDGKAATVCGLGCEKFVLHAFYASRSKKDKLRGEERRSVLTEVQEDDLIEQVTGIRHWEIPGSDSARRSRRRGG